MTEERIIYEIPDSIYEYINNNTKVFFDGNVEFTDDIIINKKSLIKFMKNTEETIINLEKRLKTIDTHLFYMPSGIGQFMAKTDYIELSNEYNSKSNENDEDKSKINYDYLTNVRNKRRNSI